MSDTNIGFNTHLNNLKNDLVTIINKSGLPVGVIYYVVKDLFMDVQFAYENALKNEKEIILKGIEEANKEIEEVNDSQKKTKSTSKKVEK